MWRYCCSESRLPSLLPNAKAVPRFKCPYQTAFAYVYPDTYGSYLLFLKNNNPNADKMPNPAAPYVLMSTSRSPVPQYSSPFKVNETTQSKNVHFTTCFIVDLLRPFRYCSTSTRSILRIDINATAAPSNARPIGTAMMEYKVKPLTFWQTSITTKIDDTMVAAPDFLRMPK